MEHVEDISVHATFHVKGRRILGLVSGSDPTSCEIRVHLSTATVPAPLWVEHPCQSSSGHLYTDYRLQTDAYTKGSIVVLESSFSKDKK
jgi:hypothetical protein